MTLINKYGEWALITGASSGIGEAFARYCAEKGLNVILVARRQERLEKLAQELEKKDSIEALPVVLDLMEDNFIQTLCEKIGDRQIGLLVNNAGFGSTGYFPENDANTEINMVKLHCLAPTILTHHFVRPMVERKKGAIIFVGSIVGLHPIPYNTTYSATKGFNMFMGKSLWYELKKDNIDVLALAPGGTRTEFSQAISNLKNPISASPEQVVKKAMQALGKKPYIVIGLHNKATVYLPYLLPQKLRLKVQGWFVKKITGFDKIR